MCNKGLKCVIIMVMLTIVVMVVIASGQTSSQADQGSRRVMSASRSQASTTTISAGTVTAADDSEDEDEGEESQSPPLSRGISCTQCGGGGPGEREAKRTYRLESIKADILRKLHLRAPPNITGRPLPALPDFQRLKDQAISVSCGGARAGPSNDDGENAAASGGSECLEAADQPEDRATTMTVIQVSRHVPPDRVTDSNNDASNVIYFSMPISDVRSTSQMGKIKLGIYIKSVRSTSNPNNPLPKTMLLIYMLTPHGRYLFKRRPITLTASQTGRWYTWILQPSELRNWIESPETHNLGLMVQGSDLRGEPIAVVTPANELEESFRPYLQVELSSRSSSERAKRSSEMNCAERSTERRCCRYPLVVDFEAFDWDWVIVPKSYSAYYCAGECPYLFYQQHAHTQVSQMARSRTAGGPCCSPGKVSSISMLYYDQNMNIVLGILPAMVVDRCGCA